MVHGLHQGLPNLPNLDGPKLRVLVAEHAGKTSVLNSVSSVLNEHDQPITNVPMVVGDQGYAALLSELNLNHEHSRAFAEASATAASPYRLEKILPLLLRVHVLCQTRVRWS